MQNVVFMGPSEHGHDVSPPEILTLPFLRKSPCKVPPFPYIYYHGYVGTFFRGRPLLCGGDTQSKGPQKTCFSINNGAWEKIFPMKQHRTFAAAVVLEEGFWVTGEEFHGFFFMDF